MGKHTEMECKIETKKFTEEDFKNPTPEMENDIGYLIAYADWSRANGLTMKFNTAEEAIRWLRSEYEKA